MIFGSSEERQRTALAKEGARALARMTEWTLKPCAAALAPPLSALGYSDQAQVIVGYGHRQLSYRRIIAAVREARTDMLMIEPGHGIGRSKRFYLTLILCRGGQPIIHKGLRLWSEDFDSPLWLVPDPHDLDAYPCSFSLHPDGIRAETVLPYASPTAAEAGIKIADLRWIAEAGGHFL